METLGVIVPHEFLDQVLQMALAEYHKLLQTLVLDRLHKALRIRITIGTLRGDLDALHTSRLQNRDERVSEQRVSIMDQVLRASKKTELCAQTFRTLCSQYRHS